MTTEVWFRNPDNYVRELVECGVGWITWDRGYLVKRHIDPQKWAALYYGAALPYRQLLVGEQGSAEYQSGADDPVAVYPTWSYGEDWAMLEEIVSQPLGQQKEICFDTSIPADERPVFGQEHRVVVIDPPNSSSGPGRQFLRNLKILQEDYPDCIIHIHGLYGYRAAFGLGLGAADVEPRTAAQKGKVHLPSGGEAKFEKVQSHSQWVAAMGFTPGDLAVPRNRCMYNIKSAIWAGKNYTELINIKVRGGDMPDITSTDIAHRPQTTLTPFTLPMVPKKAGDKFACDSCSLSSTCKHYREGAVCSLPDSESRELATHFQTRDSGLIMDGLAEITRIQSRRAERALSLEEIDGEVSKEVTGLLNAVFEQGTKLAKLIDPSLRAGPSVNINTGPGGHVSIEATPQQKIAAIYRELEMRGVPRSEITPDMVRQLLGELVEHERPAIPSTVISSEVIRDEQAG